MLTNSWNEESEKHEPFLCERMEVKSRENGGSKMVSFWWPTAFMLTSHTIKRSCSHGEGSAQTSLHLHETLDSQTLKEHTFYSLWPAFSAFLLTGRYTLSVFWWILFEFMVLVSAWGWGYNTGVYGTYWLTSWDMSFEVYWGVWWLGKTEGKGGK